MTDQPPRCAYAACTRVATDTADGWDFCRGHLLEHEALQRNDERVAREPRWRSKHDIDPIAVDLAVAGCLPGKLTRAERLSAVEQLHRAGMGSRRIAAHLQIHLRQATRDLADLRQQHSEAS
jgi:hypothetical protein